MAIPVPADVAAALAALVPAHPALRPVDPSLLHFTLAFLGALPEERVAQVTAASAAGAGGARTFGVPIDQVGRFPPSGSQRVVWAGSGDAAAAGRIVELGARVRAELARASIPFDPKPLLPHVTLARVREDATGADLRAVREDLAGVRVPPGLVIEVRAVHVMESVLGSKGPRYSSRARVDLSSAAGGRPQESRR